MESTKPQTSHRGHAHWEGSQHSARRPVAVPTAGSAALGGESASSVGPVALFVHLALSPPLCHVAKRGEVERGKLRVGCARVMASGSEPVCV